MEKRKTVALIYGGEGKEHEISLLGADFVTSSLMSLKNRGIDTLLIRIEKDGQWYIHKNEECTPTFPIKIGGQSGFIKGAEIVPVDCAFPLLHGDFGEDGKIQGALDSAKISYVGCGVLAGALCSDKALTKMIAERLGILTVPWICEDSSAFSSCYLAKKAYAEKKIGYPMFIKPAEFGSSVGASAVFDGKDFDAAIELAIKSGAERLLIEKYIEKRRELECACLVTRDKRIFSRPAEIQSGRFYSYTEKYSKASEARLILEPELDARTVELVRSYSELLVNALCIRDLCRVDFFLSEDQLYFNEINTMPGFTSSSLYPRLIEREGVATEELVSLLVDAALARKS